MDNICIGAPISRNIIEPVIVTNIEYVDSLEDFEQIILKQNETRLAFDNNKECFYVRNRDNKGDYQPVKIYFYENFAQKVQNLKREEFVQKCKDVGLDELKTKIACMFFLDNAKPQDVWEWALQNTTKNWEWDYVRALKCRLKKN